MTLVKHGSGFAVLVAAALALAPAAARAQGFVELYFGAGFPQEAGVDVGPDDFDPSLTLDGDLDDDATPSLGIRGGYWFDDPGFNFVGIGLDLSYYGASGEVRCAPPLCDAGNAPDTDLDLYVAPLTPLLMLRIPIAATEEIPGGRLQPYAAVGPAFNLSFAYSELDDLGPDVGLVDDFEAGSFDVGLDARGGLAFQVARHFALYGEYRYTYFTPEYEDEVDDVFAFDFDTDLDLETDVEVHHVVFGVSFRF
jgi:opacity protein-like surface antigen